MGQERKRRKVQQGRARRGECQMIMRASNEREVGTKEDEEVNIG